MRIVDIIEKKKSGKSLEKSEIDFLLDEYLNNNIPDYQMSAYLMAVFFKGMTEDELAYFTLKMRDSGDVISFPDIDKFLVDKHSTGGVGDKVTVILGSLLAALGMATTKLSGKGLGHTGGTIDKFESIKDFEFSSTRKELVDIVNKTGVGIMGYSDTIVPLDKKLYSLRDVTGTVNSIPLIASSIMSKKLAIESNIIILDVKFGDGAFMKTVDDARELARTMVKIGNNLGRKTVALLTSMEEPLGSEVGNSNEIIEGIEALKGNWSDDVKEVVYYITYLALKEKGEVTTFEEASFLLDKVIEDGSALAIFKEFIKESGGKPELVNNYSLLPTAKSFYEVKSISTGYVNQIKAEEIGIAAMIIGAGRATKEDLIDHAVGITLHKKVGDYVKSGELLARIHFNDEKNLENSRNMILDAYKIQDSQIEKKKVVLEIVE
ncbi:MULTISPECIES: thymidine phosphorylase [unclassified Gemella]|uniref:thymidine phosphorylase n=1 Tax=unclassified Gemella TaxID=2624949 RepID=UPI00107369DF|nr:MULTISPECIES: thymidine phosphorylase [unclassified Gemella]MBF0710266.1 thymidine phosphorylase [Gemella sp. GL1.1]MBF0746306.1 thymidine phosphorylase [Gemella sp. 19428wG2_WT2a]NYS27610.1 thymidine phosphorylase [Gemella sp. GL1]TFU60582.1 thymidine phosphorylase [Gemella sp. WT2a]